MTDCSSQEVSGSETTASIEYRNTMGEVVESKAVTLDAFGLAEVRTPDGLLSARITPGPGGRIVAYATPVDTASYDMWVLTDWSKVTGYDPFSFRKTKYV